MAQNLDPEIIAGLLALYDACNRSAKAHVPLKAMSKKLKKPYKPFAKSIMKKLRKAGYVNIHKGREISYAINMAGIMLLIELKIIQKNRKLYLDGNYLTRSENVKERR